MGLLKKTSKMVPASAPMAEVVSKIKEEISATQSEPEARIEYKEIPVCMSQEAINNLVIENNIMLKEVMANLD